MRKVKLVSVFVLLALLLSAGPGAVVAQEPPPPKGEGNRANPNYAYTAEELEALNAKDRQARQYIEKLERDLSRASVHTIEDLPSGLWKKFEERLSIAPCYSSNALLVGVWKEPNDWAHRNYCGPGATQVALDARLPASQVPDIDTIGREENINPNSGIWIGAIRPVLNNHLGTGWYVYDNDIGSEATLFWRTIFDVDLGWALTSGCVTDQMPGWNGHHAYHIVAIVGYIDSDDYTDCIAYTETAGSVAGYNGDYWQLVSKGDMWQYVEGDDAMVW